MSRFSEFIREGRYLRNVSPATVSGYPPKTAIGNRKGCDMPTYHYQSESMSDLAISRPSGYGSRVGNLDQENRVWRYRSCLPEPGNLPILASHITGALFGIATRLTLPIN